MPPLVKRVALVLGLLVLVVVPLATPGAATDATADRIPLTAKSAAFQARMRKLWEDHITWTRLFIVDFAAGSPETQATLQRLLQNQVDIGDAIKPFYGAAAGDQLAALLKQHILLAGDVLTAAKAGDNVKLAAANGAWYANADAIAAFLSRANPTHWPRAAMQTMMHEHLDNTLAEASAHLKGNWTADIAAYDKVHAQILEMADMLSQGIIAQFPARFA